MSLLRPSDLVLDVRSLTRSRAGKKTGLRHTYPYNCTAAILQQSKVGAKLPKLMNPILRGVRLMVKVHRKMCSGRFKALLVLARASPATPLNLAALLVICFRRPPCLRRRPINGPAACHYKLALVLLFEDN